LRVRKDGVYRVRDPQMQKKKVWMQKKKV